MELFVSPAIKKALEQIDDVPLGLQQVKIYDPLEEKK